MREPFRAPVSQDVNIHALVVPSGQISPALFDMFSFCHVFASILDMFCL